MFKKSGTTSQMDLFSSPEMFLGKRANKSYSDPGRWHNVFFDQVTSKIDEDLFSVLYKSGNIGVPTASVRVLVAMSILKEGFGCCDEDLFEKVEFDLLVRKALGLVSLDDAPPSLDTYCLFNRRLCEYHERTDIDLMEKCFESITGQQIRKFNISGKSVRMDSKLIGSNIARYSRYEIVLRTLQKTLGNGANITETAGDDGKPSLITSVQVEGATASDCRYVEDAVAKTERVTGQTVENLYADGAYQSPENREFAKGHANANGESMKIKTGRMQGGARFILKPVENSEDIEVTDTSAGMVYRGVFINKTERRGRRWRIKLGEGDWRQKPIYINQKLEQGTYKRGHEGDRQVTKEELSLLLRDSSDNTDSQMFLTSTKPQLPCC